MLFRTVHVKRLCARFYAPQPSSNLTTSDLFPCRLPLAPFLSGKCNISDPDLHTCWGPMSILSDAMNSLDCPLPTRPLHYAGTWREQALRVFVMCNQVMKWNGVSLFRPLGITVPTIQGSIRIHSSPVRYRLSGSRKCLPLHVHSLSFLLLLKVLIPLAELPTACSLGFLFVDWVLFLRSAVFYFCSLPLVALYFTGDSDVFFMTRSLQSQVINLPSHQDRYVELSYSLSKSPANPRSWQVPLVFIEKTWEEGTPENKAWPPLTPRSTTSPCLV